MNNLFWAGKKTIVTGGSSGIGKHVAADLLRLGAHVAIVADGSDKLERAEAELKQISAHVWSHACDVARLDDIDAMAREYREQV